MPRAPHELAAVEQAKNQLKNAPDASAPMSLMSSPGMSLMSSPGIPLNDYMPL